MASVDNKGIACSASNDTKAGESSGTVVGLNAFANDGSFLELFKKKMDEESQKPRENDKKTAPIDCGVKDEPRGSLVEESTGNVPGITSLMQQGKRKLATGKMGGASKQKYAKKKKEEKEAAEAAKKAEEEGEGKSSAWKAYMEEVKKYREMTCSDDVDRVRPLVK